MATIRAPGRGELAVRMTIERDGDVHEAYSRPSALRQLVGTPKYLLGRLLRRVPPHGSAVLVRGITLGGPSSAPVLAGAMESPVLGNFRVDGTVRDGVVQAVLRRAGQPDSVGALRMSRDASAPAPRDYARLSADIRRTFEESLFDPSLLKTAPWQSMLSGLDRALADARDDLDALLSFYALKPSLGMSHIELTRDPEIAAAPLESLFARQRGGLPPDSLVFLSFPAPRVAVLRVRKFDQVTGIIDGAFTRIDSARPHTLVIDVRGNPGGDVSSVAALSHLIRDSLNVGAFLGRKWFAAHGHDLPGPADLPRFAREDALTVLYTVREKGGTVGVVPPRAPYFGGDVYLLVDHVSGSASEPLAAAVKQSRRGLVIGETTAGAMLVAPPHSIGQGFVLVVPEADFRTVDGTRIEGRGVEPDIRAPSNDALAVVADRIAATDAYSAAFVRGAARVEARRWDDALKEYDAVLAAQPNDLRALYQLGRVAALSGHSLERGEAALRRYIERSGEAAPSLPSRSVALWRLGTLLEAAHRAGDARRAYAQAVDADATNTLARTALARLPAPAGH